MIPVYNIQEPCRPPAISAIAPVGYNFQIIPSVTAQNFGTIMTVKTCSPEQVKADLDLIKSRQQEPTKPLNEVIKRPKAK